MARRQQHRTSRTAARSPRLPRESSPLFQTTNAHRLLSAFLQILVLAVNLFGWTLVPVSDAAARPSAASAVAEMFPDAIICEHFADPQSGQGSSHDKMVCPACFPLGNAANGALAAVALAVPVPFAPPTERNLPADSAASSAFHPSQYQARAPPPTV